MTDEEARQFEAHRHHAAAVQVRRYDDMGKVAGMKTPDLESYRDLILRFALGARHSD
jgi:predicted HD phosphohydrolase